MDGAPSARRGILAVTLLYLLVGLLFVEAVPPWEAPDEPWHLAYAETLAAGRLPAAADTYESHQPPLYYLWPGLALRLLDVSDVPRGTDNPRYPFALAAYLHPPADPATGWLRLLRSFSGLLGALVVVLCWTTARVVLPAERVRPLLAAGIAALLPQFAFIAHSISNDVLAAAVGAWLSYALVRLVARPAQPRVAVVLLTVGAVLAALTKLNVLAMVPAMLLATLLAARRAGWSGRRVAGTAALVGLSVVAVALALAWRLPAAAAALGAQARMRGLEVRPELVDARLLAHLAEQTLTSLAGRFGWLNVDFPAGLQVLWVLAAALAAAGCARAIRRAGVDQRAALLVCATIVAGLAAATFKNLLVDQQPQGRLLFPALAALATLLAVGWTAFLRPARWPWATAAVLAALLSANLYATQWLLPRAYAESRRPQPALDARRLPRRWTVAARLTGPADHAEQTFRALSPGLHRVELPVASAEGSGELRLRLLAADGTGRPLGTATVPLAGLRPNDWVGLDVGPLADSAGQAYRLELAVADGVGSVWLWGAADGSDYPEGVLTVNGHEETDLVLLTWLDADGPG
jgi:hypothetical protein